MRIVIGEDSALFREGLARLLDDAGHEIVATAADADALEAAVHDAQPDVAIIDIRMPRDVLALMAEGRTNVGIAKRLYLSERTIETHVANILGKLDLAGSEEDHRRVLAVVTYLRDATTA